MRTTSYLAGCFIVLLCPSALSQGPDFDVSRDYLTETNPGPVWSYGWKPTLTGPFTPLTVHLTQSGPSGPTWEFWARSPIEPTSVYRNAGTETLTSDGGAGTYPPGSVWFGPGPEHNEDRFGVIRFTVPSGHGGRYRLATTVQTRLDRGASDADFHVLHNTRELFGRNIVPVSAASYTNDLVLADGDTIDFICGRGDDGIEYGGGLKITASISNLNRVTIRVSQVEVCWESETNRSYQVQYRSALTANQWVPLHANFIPGTGTTLCTADPVSPAQPRRFYQVVTSTNGAPAP